MAQSLANLYVHAIFSTKDRVACLPPDVSSELHRYTATVLNEIGCNALEVGGVADHVHVLCRFRRTDSIADLIIKMKTPTSRWLKTKGGSLRNFSWQRGYGAFTVSHSDVDRVREYIRDQEEHHRKMTFQEEYRQFLTRNGVEFDERYVWD